MKPDGGDWSKRESGEAIMEQDSMPQRKAAADGKKVCICGKCNCRLVVAFTDSETLA